MRRGARHCLVWLGSVAAALILVIGFCLWRLMQGPIELDRLTPYVEEALSRSTDGLQIAVSGVRFAIDRDNHRLDLQLEGVRLSRPEGEPVAAFSEMSATFSLSALLRGNLVPTRLIVERPVLHFIRDPAGQDRSSFRRPKWQRLKSRTRDPRTGSRTLEAAGLVRLDAACCGPRRHAYPRRSANRAALASGPDRRYGGTRCRGPCGRSIDGDRR